MATESSPGGILFAALPASARINAVRAVAAELNSREESGEIWFASTEDRRRAVESIPGRRPVRFVSIGANRPELDPENWTDEELLAMANSSRLKGFSAFLSKNVDWEFRDEQYVAVLAAIDEARPAVLVVDALMTGAIDAALIRGVPYVTIVTMPVSGVYNERLPRGYPTPYSGLPFRMSIVQRVRNRLFRLGVIATVLSPSRVKQYGPMVRARQEAGMANPASRASLYADEAAAVIAASVFGIEYPFPPPPQLKMVGTVLPPEFEQAATSGDDITAWLDAHESVVYIGLGTITRLTEARIRQLLDAVRRLAPHQVLWKVSKRQQALLPPPGEWPENLRVETWLPSQLAVLAHPHVKVFVNHGGANAVHEGLYFSQPLLVLPFWMDCHDLAARVIDSGAGLAAKDSDAQRTGKAIAEKASRLLAEPSFAERAGHWSRRLREAGGAKAAADIVLAQISAASLTA